MVSKVQSLFLSATVFGSCFATVASADAAQKLAPVVRAVPASYNAYMDLGRSNGIPCTQGMTLECRPTNFDECRRRSLLRGRDVPFAGNFCRRLFTR